MGPVRKNCCGTGMGPDCGTGMGPVDLEDDCGRSLARWPSPLLQATTDSANREQCVTEKPRKIQRTGKNE